jgi:hypothetical protein
MKAARLDGCWGKIRAQLTNPGTFSRSRERHRRNSTGSEKGEKIFEGGWGNGN